MAARPNVVWLTLESTRADHTSVNGTGTATETKTATTPALERIADRPQGRSFSKCFSHGVWTLSSSASILSGLHASRHDTGVGSDVFPESFDTAAERFRDAGYRTACLSPNSHLSSATGLDRGFDEFAWLGRSTLTDVAGPLTLAKFLWNLRRHSAGFTTDTSKHDSDYVSTEVVKRWLRSFEGEDEPFFCYLHYGGPHHEYHPPRPFRRTFAADLDVSPSEAAAVSERHHDDLNELVAEGCPFTDEEWAAIEAMYDGEIAHTDALVGDLFEYVTETLDLEDTIVVITADHGELFGEQGLLAHKVVVDDAVTHVPLVVHGADFLADCPDGIVQHADVMRTLLEVAGADTDGLQGLDLREETRDHAILQRGQDRCERNLDAFADANPAFDADRYHRSDLHAIRTEEFKYCWSEDGSELFELPDETRGVTEKYPDVAAALHETLQTWLQTEGRPIDAADREGEFSDAMREQLADLGYIV